MFRHNQTTFSTPKSSFYSHRYDDRTTTYIFASNLRIHRLNLAFDILNRWLHFLDMAFTPFVPWAGIIASLALEISSRLCPNPPYCVVPVSQLLATRGALALSFFCRNAYC